MKRVRDEGSAGVKKKTNIKKFYYFFQKGQRIKYDLNNLKIININNIFWKKCQFTPAVDVEFIDI